VSRAPAKVIEKVILDTLILSADISYRQLMGLFSLEISNGGNHTEEGECNFFFYKAKPDL
jgi:hypothetical protein